MLLPRPVAASKASIAKEFVALRYARVLLALLTSVLCSASLFTDVSGFSAAAVAPILLLNQAAFNLGNAVGAWIGSRLLSVGVPLAELSRASVALTLGALGLAAWGSLLGSRSSGLVQTQSR